MPNEIRIHPPKKPLKRGERKPIGITVVLENAVKVRGIHAEFHAAEETKADYTTTRTDSKGRTTTQTHTAVELVEIAAQAEVLSGNERLGFLGNLSDAAATMFGGGKHESMPPGEYPFEVEICLPTDAPPTHEGRRSRVFYELSVQVDIPLAFDLKEKLSFPLPPIEQEAKINPVRTRYPDDEGRGFFDSLFGPDVNIELALAGDRYRLGEEIHGFLQIETPKPLNCNAIRARLVGFEKSRARGHTDSAHHHETAFELSTPNVIADSYKQEFTFPATAAGPHTARGQNFSIDWFVQIELDVPWAKDPKIRAPITLLRA